jgi:energy-coupling factor transporter ATP-binding protein EcfA2
MKITRIELNDFRAFANPEAFDLGDGKNMLLYGANGAGKSSLFRALKEIFNHSSPEPFSAHKNIFTEETRTDGCVKLHFSEPAAPGTPNTQAEWLFPGPRASGDQRIVQGALRLGTLDYRALLDTNYVFKDGDINLFDVLVKGVLRPWMVNAGTRGLVRLGTLWDETLAKRIPTPTEQCQAHRARGGGTTFRAKNQIQRRIDVANNTATIFNDALRISLRKIVLLGNRLLRRLGVKGLSFVLTPAAVTYDPDDRAFSPQRIDIRVRFNGTDVPRPQLVLNEARLSALALSLYFAALLKVVPDDPAWPRVLLLDDVLIGLDMDNRLPVLDILRHEFRNWQVLLLTHDRAWFELAQIEIGDLSHWEVCETFARAYDSGTRVFEIPEVRHPPRNAGELKTLAEHHIARAKAAAGTEDRIAAFHTRVAFECKLKAFCHNNNIPVRYDLEHGTLDTGDFLKAAEHYLEALGTHTAARFQIQRVKLFRRGVLNLYAHFHPVTISPAEVQMAIAAVEAMDLKKSDTDFCSRVTSFVGRPALNQQQAVECACWLRTVFEVDLRDMLVRLNGNVAFRHNWSELPLADLWASAKIAMQTRNNPLALQLIPNIELHAAVFLNEFTYAHVSAFDKPTLDAAWAILCGPAHQNPVKTRLATFS